MATETMVRGTAVPSNGNDSQRPDGRGPHRRVALVHDFLLDLRGAERVFAIICGLFPEADIFTAVYDEEGTEGRFAHRRVHASFLQALHPTARSFRGLLPVYPLAMETLDLRGYDLVLSSSSAWAHGVIVDDDATHACYCHNPFRYAWNERDATLAGRSPLIRPALGAVLDRWRGWDRRVAAGVDGYIANSEITRERIRGYLDRESVVVPPPVQTERFRPGPLGNHYVLVSELMSHKRIDVAVEAFNALGEPLVIVGDGPQESKLRQMARPNVCFTGRVSDADLAALVSSSLAFVVTAVEEFGIAAVEAQAAGRPVVAPDRGGTLDTVLDGETGCFYPTGDAAGLAAAVGRLQPHAFDPLACVSNAARFDVDHFQPALLDAIGHASRDRSPARIASRGSRRRRLTSMRASWRAPARAGGG